MALHGEGRLRKIFRDEARVQAGTRGEVAVVDGSQEGGLNGAEGFSMKILGKFSFSKILDEDAVCLVWVGERW